MPFPADLHRSTIRRIGQRTLPNQRQQVPSRSPLFAVHRWAGSCGWLLFVGLAAGSPLDPLARSVTGSEPELPAPAEAEQLRFFETKIRPVLVEHCYACHSIESADLGGKLLLDSREGLRVGGESGPLVPVPPEDLDASLLLAALRHEGPEMPPDQRLSDAVVEDFTRWLRWGAPDPRESTAEAIAAAQRIATDPVAELWSLRPLSSPAVPLKLASETASDDELELASDWPRDAIDRFVLAGLLDHDLTPAGDAPPRRLIRRLSFDLIGLPPEPARVEEFVTQHAAAPERAIAELVEELLASPHFGERWGRHWLDVARFGESNGNDGLSRNASFPHAWRYRDYVIDAFNADLPYDQFVTEQIAGDLLESADPAVRDRRLVATGFLAIGSKPAKAMNVDFDMDVVADQIDVVSTAVMGLSVACARCHDHKHDPISTRDYYALAGIFQSTETLWGAAANEKLTAPATPLHTLASLPPRPGPEPSAGGKGKTPPAAEPQPAVAMGVREAAKVIDCKINLKGQSNKLGEEVPRGFLTSVGGQSPPPTIPEGESGRRQLAEWLTSPDHPLTARVMVNRVWMHLLGQPLVGTPDDFGHYGDQPSHPELLDHLAITFQRDGWSIKSLIRRIVLSRTYQLDSTALPDAIERDPDNRWLGRHPRKRLDAESLRDRMLAVSGQLDLNPSGGSAIEHLDVLVNKHDNLHRPSRSRSVYLCLLRNSPPPELAAFDFPDALRPQGKRSLTTLPAQSLYLLNSPFVVAVSRQFAQRVLASVGESLELAVDEAFQLAVGRSPTAEESQRSLALLANWPIAVPADGIADNSSEQPNDRVAALAAVCQALLASNEFRYLD